MIRLNVCLYSQTDRLLDAGPDWFYATKEDAEAERDRCIREYLAEPLVERRLFTWSKEGAVLIVEIRECQEPPAASYQMAGAA